jgi:Protein of unknown function (DUF3540)
MAKLAKPKPKPILGIDVMSGNEIMGQWLVGHVCKDVSGSLKIRSASRILCARKAVSCLVEPMDGDVVGCLKVAPQEVWITCILSREIDTPITISMEGDASIQVKTGKLTIESKEMHLESERMGMLAKHVALGTETAEMVARDVSVVSTTFKLVCSFYSLVAQRMTQFSKSYFRATDGMDKVEATHVEISAQQLMRLDADHALITGKRLVKARGSQIHFG